MVPSLNVLTRWTSLVEVFFRVSSFGEWCHLREEFFSKVFKSLRVVDL